MSTTSLFLLIFFGLMTANESIQKNFKIAKKVPLLRFADIISTHHVHTEIDCSFCCVNEPSCVGFKYKDRVSNPSENCQLSNTTGEDNMADDQGWVYFVDIKSKLVHGSSRATHNIPPEHSECFEYQWLNESDRNQRSSYDFNCDDGLLGWYRFGGGAGSKMATSCVPEYSCGTYKTGWMNGTHPTVTDGNVTRKVCYTWDVNCCWSSDNIEVINCGQYYVYKLSAPSAGCSSRYCGSDN